MKWRDDNKNTEQPTAGAVVICAQDFVETKTPYWVFICHIRGLRGNGFMAIVRSDGSSSTGKINYGTGEEAYQAALSEGAALLENRVHELNERMARGKRMMTAQRINFASP